MKLLKTFLIFFIVFGVLYFFTGFILAEFFNYANWSETNRGLIMISFFIALFNYMWDTTPIDWLLNSCSLK